MRPVPKDTPSPLLRKVGARVRQLREERGWSQVRLAARSGVHRVYLSGIERGIRNCTILHLAKLARAGRWNGDEVIVAYVTGHGLKTADVLASVDGQAKRVEIEPTLKSFREKVSI